MLRPARAKHVAPKFRKGRIMPSHRKRLHRIEAPGHARYLTCSCYHRLALLGNPAIRDAFADQIECVHARSAFRLLAWVVMPEHFHLLLLIPNLPEWTVPKILQAVKRPFAQRVIARWRGLAAPILDRLRDASGVTHFWQRGGGYDRNIVSDEELYQKIEYLHANPVQRGLIDRPLDWAWSSARWYEGIREGPITIDHIG
ncbi:MAG: transposase [Planctomycetota bacterium]|nr:transposase [Planctomycetota bacterium]